MTGPVLSLVTGTRNRQESFTRLLDSIIRNTSVSWELIVSDASDETYQLDYPGNVVVIAERPRLGCVRGYNAAFERARGVWVLWLNDDAEVLPNYANVAIDFMESHPRIGLGALMYSENGGPFRVNSAWGAIYANFGILRRELGERVGWFDEDLEMYGCDNSISIRVLMAGHGVAGIEDAKVIHHSEQDHLRVENQRSRIRDTHILQHKYLPLRDQWLNTYNCLRVPGPEPWQHGVDPDEAARRISRRRGGRVG